MKRVLVIRNDATDPVGRFGDWLRAGGVEVVELLADAGDSVPDRVPVDIDGVIALGGEVSATDDHVAPWLAAERDLLRHADDTGVPTLGICLGGQLLTVALGGVVDRTPTPEIGVVDLDWASAARIDSLFAVAPAPAPVAQYHLDRMRDLPPDAVVLASTADCPHQAWRRGDSTWAVQFHPEVDADRVSSWLGAEATELGFDIDRVAADLRARDGDVAAAWEPVARRFAAIVTQR